MIFESHAHYDDEGFNEDREELLKRLPKEGIKTVINIGITVNSSKQCIKLANKYDYIYAAIGVHPHEVSNMDDDKLEQIKEMTKEPKVVSIGEIGLDYYYNHSPRDVQKLWFKKQIELAKEVKKPIVVHSREAEEDTFNIIKETNAKEVGGVIHCFGGSAEMAVEYVKLGFYIGVGGVVTYKNGKKLKRVVEQIPLEHLLIETDSPYLAPVPKRGKRNDSTNLVYVIKQIAELKGIDYDEVVKVTRDNGMKLFLNYHTNALTDENK